MRELNRWALPVLLLAVALLGFVLPVARMKRRFGHSGLVSFSTVDPVERWLGVGLAGAVALVAAFTLLLLWLGPHAVGVVELPAVVGACGWLLGLAGLAVTIAAQAQMGRSWRVGIDAAATALVTSGLYRHVRNPIYSGMMLLLASLVLLAPCSATLLLALGAAWMLAFQTRREEQHLIALHGETFLAWARSTGRFLPGLGRL